MAWIHPFWRVERVTDDSKRGDCQMSLQKKVPKNGIAIPCLVNDKNISAGDRLLCLGQLKFSHGAAASTKETQPTADAKKKGTSADATKKGASAAPASKKQRKQ